MPNQTSQLTEQRIVAFSLGHPALGPRRISATLAQERWGGIVVSANGVWRVLRRHGLSRRISRLSLVAGYAAPPGPERVAPPPERHLDAGADLGSVWLIDSTRDVAVRVDGVARRDERDDALSKHGPILPPYSPMPKSCHRLVPAAGARSGLGRGSPPT